jgi:hypothetical protein
LGKLVDYTQELHDNFLLPKEREFDAKKVEAVKEGPIDLVVLKWLKGLPFSFPQDALGIAFLSGRAGTFICCFLWCSFLFPSEFFIHLGGFFFCSSFLCKAFFCWIGVGRFRVAFILLALAPLALDIYWGSATA